MIEKEPTELYWFTLPQELYPISHVHQPRFQNVNKSLQHTRLKRNNSWTLQQSSTEK